MFSSSRVYLEPEYHPRTATIPIGAQSTSGRANLLKDWVNLISPQYYAKFITTGGIKASLLLKFYNFHI